MVPTLIRSCAVKKRVERLTASKRVPAYHFSPQVFRYFKFWPEVSLDAQAVFFNSAIPEEIHAKLHGEVI
jgi:hypothetical protein